MNDKRGFLYGAGVLLVIMVLVELLGPDGTPVGIAQPRGGQDAAPKVSAAPNSIKISITTSTTKKPWMNESIEKFNENSKTNGQYQAGGRPVFVEVILEEPEPGRKEHYRSGTQIKDTLEGKIKPTIVSPADDAWIERLNREWKATHQGRAISTGAVESLTNTPQVIAIWQSRAEALGCWPEAGPGCTWERVRALAVHPDGWGMLGRREWGKFKFGYGYVGESESGTMTAFLMCRLGAATSGELSIEQVAPETGCGRAMGDLERSKVHSGVSSSWLLQQMTEGGPEYLDAISTQEKEVVAFNQANARNLREPLVAAYLQDGTIVPAHPFVILDGAEWVTQEQVQAARVFQRYLMSDERQRALLSHGLRPADPAARLGPPIERANGANPQANVVAVRPPDPLVFNQIVEVWHRVKKPATIALVFDKSGSMSGQKITAAVKGAQEFVRRMDRIDRISWMPFDNLLHPSVVGFGADVGEELIGKIGGTPAGGGTALYDAILSAFEQLENQRREDPFARRYGIVILSDGQDTNSKASLAQVEARLKPGEGDPTAVQIHTIAIGNDADKGVLTKIASAGHGRFWTGQTVEEMIHVYRTIATYY